MRPVLEVMYVHYNRAEKDYEAESDATTPAQLHVSRAPFHTINN